MSVAELMEQTAQSREDILQFLETKGVMVFPIGSERFFLRTALHEIFSSVATKPDSSRGPSSPTDELERQKVIEELKGRGLDLVRREGIRDMVAFFRVRSGLNVGIDLFGREPDSFPLHHTIEHRFKIYISKKTTRGVAHFSATGFLDNPPIVDEDSIDLGDIFIFRSAELGISFLRTQSELIQAWNALRGGRFHVHKGVRLYGKRGLQMTFSRAKMSLVVERRIICQKAND